MAKDIRSIALDRTGDGLNDISMVESAGTGVGMGNAVDEVRRTAEQITATNDEDGAAAVIEALL